MFGGIEGLQSLQDEHANLIPGKLMDASFRAPTADSPTADSSSSELSHVHFSASKSFYYVSEDRRR